MMIIEEKIKDKEKQEDNQPSKGKVWCHVGTVVSGGEGNSRDEKEGLRNTIDKSRAVFYTKITLSTCLLPIYLLNKSEINTGSYTISYVSLTLQSRGTSSDD